MTPFQSLSCPLCNKPLKSDFMLLYCSEAYEAQNILAHDFYVNEDSQAFYLSSPPMKITVGYNSDFEYYAYNHNFYGVTIDTIHLPPFEWCESLDMICKFLNLKAFL